MSKRGRIAALVAAAGAAFGLAGSAATTPNPTSVTIAGDLQSELGCSGDWQPDCAATHLAYDANDDVWQASFSVPAGSWQYKAALNGSWDENYGMNAAPGGANIPLNLSAPTTVKFYYDHKTHWVTDNVTSRIVTAPGNYQHALGCAGDWDPGCLRSWLEDPDGNGVYTMETTALPAGNYEAKAAINESWNENYGAGGARNGPNVQFTVPFNGAKVDFSYDDHTHVLSITAGHAQDGNVEWNGLRFDSRDTLYRTPKGAVPAGTAVTFRFRTFHDDVTGVKMRVYDTNTSAQQLIAMKRVASGVSCYQDDLSNDSCDYWQARLTPGSPDVLWYRFIASDGSTNAYYADDTTALDGGLGRTTSDPVDNSYALVVYDPSFTTPSWAKSAVIYQIFPDRFRNGNKQNDPKTGDPRYDDPVLKLPWNTLPEGYCRSYADASATTCPWRFDKNPPSWSPTIEGPRGRDYMGGDLQGIVERLDYLQSLGVNALYLNPIFASKSNHGYDTSDYKTINPYFGDLQDFRRLIDAARGHRIRVILDGVFNHMSSDSPFFDRYHHYSEVGACESLTSQWRAWFTFTTSNVPCGAGDYTGWFGFDSIPVLNKSNPAVQDYFVKAQDSVTRLWLQRGAAGWRLDVMGDSSFPNGYWQAFRQVVKQTDPNALIVGELWPKDTTTLRFLDGQIADSTMNYRLRDAVTGLLAPQPFDGKGLGDSGRILKPSEAAARLASIFEDYPKPAAYSLMNLLDSHDTARLLWALTPGAATPADKEQNAANLAEGKARLRLASLIQFGLPGAPTIYYGDEAGMTGADDPDDRRTYPWTDTGGHPDDSLIQWYQQLGAARHALPALTDGEFRVLSADDSAGTLAFGRKTTSQAAIVAVNRSSSAQTIDIPTSGFVPDGIAFTAKIGAGGGTTADGKLHLTLAPLSGALLATGDVDLEPPSAPSGLAASAGPGQVALSWNGVDGAAAYNVYRSPVTGGGYVKANSTPLTGTSFTDTGLRNGQIDYYVVRAVDSAGNESNDSNEASAVPHATIGYAVLQWPKTITMTLSAYGTENVYGQVYVAGVTDAGGSPSEIEAAAGFGPRGTAPGDPAWTWFPAGFNVRSGNNYEYVTKLYPQSAGTYDYAYRFSTDGGVTWTYGDQDGGAYDKPGVLTVNPPSDTTAPRIPQDLHVVAASPTSIELAWSASTDPDDAVAGYDVLRSTAAGGPYTSIASVTGTTYSDTAVDQDATYYYVVRAFDTANNHSGNSAEVSAVAALRTVAVTFTVTVPSTTDLTGRTVHIAGTLSRLDGGLPDWDPGAVTLTRVDPTHWTITLHGREGTQIEYKYTLGDWDHVEKDASCGEIANRQLTLAYGTSGAQDVNDTVQQWRNVAPCGN